MTGWFLAVPMALSLVQDVQPLTLNDAIRIGLQNSFGIRIAESNLRKTGEQIREAEGSLWPKLTLGATYTRFDKATVSDGIVFSPIDSKQAQLVLSAPIDLAGNLGQAVRAAEATKRARQADIVTEANNLKERIRAAFYQVLQAEALVQVNSEAVKNNEERLQVARSKFENGAVPKVEVLRAETTLRQSESDLVTAKNRMELAKSSLNNTIGRDIRTSFDAVEVNQLTQVAATSGELIEVAWKNRPELISAESQIEALKLAKQIAGRGLQPSLNVSLTYSRTIDPGFGQRESSGTGVLAFSWPLWDKGVTRARVAQAEEDVRQAQVRVDQLKLGISLEVDQAVTNLRNAQARLTVVEKQVELAKETYRLAKLRSDEGEGIQLEVTDAQTELTRAQTGLVTARYDYLTAYSELLRALGLETISPSPTATKENSK